jgi:hypothetical protein
LFFSKLIFFVLPRSGIFEAGWNPPVERTGSRSRTPDDPDMLYNAFRTILHSTKNHQSAWPFLVPILFVSIRTDLGQILPCSNG